MVGILNISNPHTGDPDVETNYYQGQIKGLQPVQIKLSFHFNYRFLKFTRMTVSNFYTYYPQLKLKQERI